MARKIETLNNFAQLIVDMLRSDRWTVIISDGEMGEGKSCFSTKLAPIIAKKLGTTFSYENNITFTRNELIAWIDGLGEDKKMQKPEYSVIICDELISLFYKRNWQEHDQKDAIELMNKCRDRHLCIIGNLPTFWDMDVALFSITTFWVHVPTRGTAWIMRKDRNLAATDKWHRKELYKIVARNKNPFRSPNFLAEVHFPDWSDTERQEYYEVRNRKRVGTEGQRIDGMKTKNMVAEHNRVLKLISLAHRRGATPEEIASATAYKIDQVNYLLDPNQIGHWLMHGQKNLKYKDKEAM